MEENIIQVNYWITINVDVILKNVMYVKNIIFRIFLHEVVIMENIYQVLWMIQQLYLMKF